MQLDKFIDKFIPHSKELDDWVYRKHRLLVSIAFISAVYGILYLPPSIFEKYYGASVIIVMFSAANVLLPFLLKWGLKLSIVSTLYILILGLSLSGIMYISGGVYHTATDPQLMVLLPVMALLFGNFRIALIWFFIAFATVATFGILQLNGVQFEILMDPKYVQFQNLLAVCGHLVLVFMVINIFEKQKNEALKKLTEKNQIIEDALRELKATQAQLIQSEKMASLGELTAGIAHEIQNPLNFVNNFSEVSNELIDELNEELNKGNVGEAKTISRDIRQNLEKINHHGKRADVIVKGMLQHSRISSGQKELADINALADEYLLLAYHGLRAKDKTFNAKLETDYDESIGNISIVPQDIGRVILNLITNAFYAVNERQKAEESSYVPAVALVTRKRNDKVEIIVKDNGNGISQSIIDKIFQPFFTTKPTGQGTGLGLSLAYDIIKAHGGKLTVETKQGEGASFFITIPITTTNEK